MTPTPTPRAELLEALRKFRAAFLLSQEQSDALSDVEDLARRLPDPCAAHEATEAARIRECCECHRPIDKCNGFVNAGDLIAFLKGERTNVRELCGLCAMHLYDDLPKRARVAEAQAATNPLHEATEQAKHSLGILLREGGSQQVDTGHWTREAPAEAGRYWYTTRRNMETLRVVECQLFDGDWFINDPWGVASWERLILVGVELWRWSLPIQLPAPPGEERET